MTARRRLIACAALPVAAGLWAVTLAVPELTSGIVLLAPSFVLLAMLASGCYLGEERLARLAARRRAPEPRRPRLERRARRLPRAPIVLPRGGRLIAAALATRPPPAGAVA